MPNYKPPISHYRHIRVNNVLDALRIMGKDGDVFKKITEKSGVDYIWWNRETKVIEIWGPHHRLMYADALVKNRIKSIENKKTVKCNLEVVGGEYPIKLNLIVN